MKGGKATGTDNIAIEQIEALEEFGISKITILPTRYMTQDIYQKIC